MTAPLRFVSFFSGVGMFDLGLKRAGMVCVGACEIDPVARKVYVARHGSSDWFPEDINAIDPADIPAADVWVGGSPCQGFSVAGRRGGLDDERSGLLRRWLELVGACRPRWFVLENVPGIFTTCSCEICDYADELIAAHRTAVGDACACAECVAAAAVRSHHRGRDFGELLATLAKLGRNAAWRVLDGRYFGVAQRRRRVFLVSGLGDGADPCPVLFESEGGGRDPSTRGEARPVTARRTARGAPSGGVAAALTRSDGHHGRRIPRGDGSDNLIAVSAIQGGGRRGHRLDAESAAGGQLVTVGTIPTLGPGGGHRIGASVAAKRQTMPDKRRFNAALTGGGIRRLTPVECERLQGLPDNWTCLCATPGTATCTCPDGPRYRVIGNGGVVNVLEWIGRRLAAGAP